VFEASFGLDPMPRPTSSIPPPRDAAVTWVQFGAGRGTRTPTTLSGLRILSPLRLPVSPSRRGKGGITRKLYFEALTTSQSPGAFRLRWAAHLISSLAQLQPCRQSSFVIYSLDSIQQRNAASSIAARKCVRPTTRGLGYAGLHLQYAAAGALRNVHGPIGGCIKFVGSSTVIGI
jgi:hypothetical protein